MANKGNPNHAPAGAPNGTGGQFVSGPQSGSEVEQKTDKQSAQAKKTVKSKAKAKFKKKPLPTLKTNDALAQMFAQLQDINQGINVPLLESAEDIDANIEKFFSKQVIGHIDRLFVPDKYGTVGYLHPKSNPNASINLFTCVFGKYRYKDNHAHLIDQKLFDKMAADVNNYTKVYRGFSSTGEKRANILKSYLTPDINNLDIYGNGCYGTNVYTTIDRSYAVSYADYDDSKVLDCLVDKNAKTIDENKLNQIRRAFSATRYDNIMHEYVYPPICDSIKKKVINHLVNNGIEQSRAVAMSKEFLRTLQNDMSLTAILLGYDYQISSRGQQRNILNLDKWFIAKRW